MKKFEIGKTYYAWTQKGEIRLLQVLDILKNGRYIRGTYNNSKEKSFEIQKGNNGDEWISPDARYNIVVTADEYKQK